MRQPKTQIILLLEMIKWYTLNRPENWNGKSSLEKEKEELSIASYLCTLNTNKKERNDTPAMLIAPNECLLLWSCGPSLYFSLTFSCFRWLLLRQQNASRRLRDHVRPVSRAVRRPDGWLAVHPSAVRRSVLVRSNSGSAWWVKYASAFTLI